MICERCFGRGCSRDMVLCPECRGTGVVSCCDTAGASAVEEKLDPEAAYRDDTFGERECLRCEKAYRGPSFYCSLACALGDA